MNKRDLADQIDDFNRRLMALMKSDLSPAGMGAGIGLLVSLHADALAAVPDALRAQPLPPSSGQPND